MEITQTYNPKLWTCFTCGIEKLATAHQLRQKSCSKKCMSIAYKSQLTGSKNPNYKNAGIRICICCNIEYHSYNKTRKYCSRQCYVKDQIEHIRESGLKGAKAPRKAKEKLGSKCVCKFCSVSFRSFSKALYCKDHKKEARKAQGKNGGRKKDPLKHLTKQCLSCNTEFTAYKTQKRIYCSYQCNLDSGGAFRAGIAASKATMKYGVKKDANHNEVIAEIRKHCAVYDLSALGLGIPDGIAWIHDSWHLFDIKNPKTAYGRRGLNPIQKKWISMHEGGPVYLIYTVEEAENFAKGNFDKVKSSKGVDGPEAALKALGL